jgi:hypothetical protein
VKKCEKYFRKIINSYSSFFLVWLERGAEGSFFGSENR